MSDYLALLIAGAYGGSGLIYHYYKKKKTGKNEYALTNNQQKIS